MVTHNFPDFNVSGTLRVGCAKSMESAPFTQQNLRGDFIPHRSTGSYGSSGLRCEVVILSAAKDLRCP
jgi:hypothetical protein